MKSMKSEKKAKKVASEKALEAEQNNKEKDKDKGKEKEQFTENNSEEIDNERSKNLSSEQESNDNTVALKKLADDANDKYVRTLAEFDNFRKRTEKEKASMYSEGTKDTVSKILPVIDNFERALKASENTEDSFYKGVDMIYKQLKGVLEGLGVTEIEAVGKPFDTNLHDAAMHIEDENYGTNEVVEELQKGYKLNDKVIRHSMVKVAN